MDLTWDFGGSCFGRIFAASAFSNDVAVDSNVTIRQEGGTRVSASGSLKISLASGHRPVVPYVTIGAGVTTSTGNPPDAVLVGRYRVSWDETDAIIDETDTVRIRLKERATPTLVVGGGVELEVSPRSGFRADIRVTIGSHTGRIVVDAMPSADGIPPFSATYTSSTAAMVFATDGSQRRSLSGPAITGFETFTAVGRQVQTAATFGYFLRF